MSASFERLATATASTKRSPAVSSGKRSTPVSNLASLAIIPLMPVSAAEAASVSQNKQRSTLGTPIEYLQTFCQGDADVLKGDVLTVSGRDYSVHFVEDWPFAGDVRLRIIVEKAGH